MKYLGLLSLLFLFGCSGQQEFKKDECVRFESNGVQVWAKILDVKKARDNTTMLVENITYKEIFIINSLPTENKVEYFNCELFNKAISIVNERESKKETK